MLKGKVHKLWFTASPCSCFIVTEILTMLVKPNKSALCSGRPSIEHAENVDCRLDMSFGESCVHQCGDVVIQSTCEQKVLHRGPVSLLTGDTIWKHTGTCSKIVKEKTVDFKGLQATTTDKTVCESNVEVLAQRIIDRILAQCTACTAEISKKECIAANRKKRSTDQNFDIELEINVTEEQTVMDDTPMQTDVATGETSEIIETTTTEPMTSTGTTESQTQGPTTASTANPTEVTTVEPTSPASSTTPTSTTSSISTTAVTTTTSSMDFDSFLDDLSTAILTEIITEEIDEQESEEFQIASSTENIEVSFIKNQTRW